MKLLPALALALPLLASTACAQSTPGSADTAQIQAIIQDYLMNNPEALRDAIQNVAEFEKTEAISAVSDDLFNNPRDISVGPANAKVTIVEFFDYNCGFCKQSTEWIRQIMEKHPEDVRVVFKELPILDSRTKTSRNAAKAAMAAARQGQYSVMHFSLMNERSLTAERVEILAKEIGLDMERWKKDMEDEAMDMLLEETLALANKIPPLSGTPFFVIGDEYVAGADTARLQALLDEGLKG